MYMLINSLKEMFTLNASPLKLLMQLFRIFQEDDMQVGGVIDTFRVIKNGWSLLFVTMYNENKCP